MTTEVRCAICGQEVCDDGEMCARGLKTLAVCVVCGLGPDLCEQAGCEDGIRERIMMIRCRALDRELSLIEKLGETIPTYLSGYPSHLGESTVKNGIRTFCGMPGVVSMRYVDCPGCQLQAGNFLRLLGEDLPNMLRLVKEAVDTAAWALGRLAQEMTTER